MTNNKIYKLLFLIVVFLYVGCRESVHDGEITPSLHPRHLNISDKEYSATSADACTTTLSVYSTETPWKFEGYPSWVSITPSSGTSNTDVSVSLTENLSADTARYSIFLFADDVDDWDYREAVSVNQPAAVPYLQLSTNSIDVSGAANEYTVTVDANAEWEATCNDSWVEIDVSKASLHLVVSENQTGVFRTAYVVVTAMNCKEIITISQMPARAESSSGELVFENFAASAVFSITSDAPWTAVVSDSWLQITPDKGDAGTTEVTIDVAPNVTITERSGYATFQCGNQAELLTIKIVQRGLYLYTHADEVIFEAQPCSHELQIESNVDWVITYCPQWATPSITNGSNNATLNIQVQENISTYERSGYIVIESPGLSLSQRVQLTQIGKTFSMGTTIMDFSDKASTNTVDIITDGTWEAHCDAAWITLSPNSSSGNSALSVSVTENTGENERIAFVNVIVSDKTIELTIRQQGKHLSLDNSQLLFPSKGGTFDVFVSTNDNWTTRLAEESVWLSLSAEAGTDDTHLTITATDNASVNERSDLLYITTENGLNVQLPIKQEARFLKVNVSDILFFARGGTSDRVTIETNGEYAISQIGDWFALSRTGNSFTVVATENKTDDWREGSITIALTDLVEGSYQITIPVKQVQVGCTFTLSGYGQDNNQDDTNGGGTLENGSYHDDVSWDASSGGLTISLQSYTVDNNWDANTTNSFTVVVTGFNNDKDWSNNGSSDTTLGKDGFDDEGNHDATYGTDITLGKEDYNNDNNHDASNATNTTLERKGFGADNNWDE